MTQTDVAKGRSSSLISSFVKILVNCVQKNDTEAMKLKSLDKLVYTLWVSLKGMITENTLNEK